MLTPVNINARRRSHLPEIYDDELIYSFAARFMHRHGLSATSTNIQLFGRAHGCRMQLPNDLDKLAIALQRSDITANRLAMRHTLFPYFTAFYTPSNKLLVLDQMIGKYALKNKGGVTIDAANSHRSLLFCCECQIEMMDKFGEFFWRRTHQLPISTMCADHAVPLQTSNVTVTKIQKGFQIASADSCPSGSATVLAHHTGVNVPDLLALTVQANALLNSYELQIDRSSAVCDLRDAFQDKKYLSPRGKSESARLLPIIEQALISLAPVKSKLIVQEGGFKPASLLPSLQRRVGSPDTTTVLLAMRVVESAPMVHADFGTGPWPCKNPASNHYDEMTITEFTKLRQYRGGSSALFKCQCGYAYTRRSFANGTLTKPRFSRYGPSLETAIARARDAGMSLSDAAARAGLPVPRMLRAMEIEGIPIHWTALPSQYLLRLKSHKVRIDRKTVDDLDRQ